MNYYEYLNKAFETNQGQNIAQNLIKYQPNANPFAQSVFNNNNADNVVKVNGVSIFDKASQEDVNKIDYDKLTAEVDAENPQKFSPLEFILKVFIYSFLLLLLGACIGIRYHGINKLLMAIRKDTE